MHTSSAEQAWLAWTYCVLLSHVSEPSLYFRPPLLRLLGPHEAHLIQNNIVDSVWRRPAIDLCPPHMHAYMCSPHTSMYID